MNRNDPQPAEAAVLGSDNPPTDTAGADPAAAPQPATAVDEIGGPQGPEPTRYGDWERKGRCVDF